MCASSGVLRELCVRMMKSVEIRAPYIIEKYFHIQVTAVYR